MGIPPLVQAVAKEPGNALYQYHLGMAYVGTGDITRARTSLEKALALDGSFPDAGDARRALASLKG
jgi:Tfp pilus assembly protein PilF